MIHTINLAIKLEYLRKATPLQMMVIWKKSRNLWFLL